MGLREYHAKRDFRRTREPRGSTKTRRGWLYVIQKHDASRLHYDFRLQLGGVLLSWAVPKGPSLDPTIKRLAMHVEDHPVDYGGFEGIIPEGEYGGGTVMLWDRGHWEPEGDPAESYRQGKLKFRLFGKKLRGEWHLIRTGSPRAGERAWLLFKVKDEFVCPENRFQRHRRRAGQREDRPHARADRQGGRRRLVLEPRDPDTKRATHQAAAKTLSRTRAAASNGRDSRKSKPPKKKTAKATARCRKTSRKSTRSGVKATGKAPTAQENRTGRSSCAGPRRFLRGCGPHSPAARHARQASASRRTMVARDQVRRLPNGRAQGWPTR